MLRLHLFPFLAIFCGQSLAAEYQWSVEVPGVISTETNAAPRAYLWLPTKTDRVKGLVYAPQNMLEQPILENAAFREAMTRLDFGILWIAPSPVGLKTFGRAEQAAIEATIQALTVESGYESLIAAPLVPMGHSAAAEMPYLMAARMPHRVLAGISLKGAWPEKQPWVKAFGESGVPLLWVSGEYEWADERAGMVSIPRWKQPKKGTFWCFDDEQRKATEALQNVFLSKKPFLVGYTQDGALINQINGTHQNLALNATSAITKVNPRYTRSATSSSAQDTRLALSFASWN